MSTIDNEPAVPYGRDFRLNDRVVVITGGGQGIGRAYAQQFAACGAISVIADVDTDKAAAVCQEIEAAGGRALAIKLDVSDEQATIDAMASVAARFGRVDALVNNAAIFTTLKMKGFHEIPLDEWERVMKVNITGCFLMVRAVIPFMKAGQFGRIVNITSGAVPLGLRNYLHYVTSKSALVGMTSSMARELGADGITVNAVQPGGTFTEVPRETMTEQAKVNIVSAQCIPRHEVPMDLVGLVLFLCTEAAQFITGQTIACDGGLTHW